MDREKMIGLCKEVLKDYWDKDSNLECNDIKCNDCLFGDTFYHCHTRDTETFKHLAETYLENCNKVKEEKGNMIKGYLASGFFDLGGYEVTDRIADIIQKYGVDVYIPQRNDEINDKEKADPTAIQIWEADINYLKQSDILFMYYDGEDAGVMAEEGYFASLLENTSKKGMIVAIYTDMRQNGKGDGHHYINLFTKGGIEKHGVLIRVDNWDRRWEIIEEGISKAIKEFKLDNVKVY